MPGIFGCYYYGEFILEKAEERFKSMSDTLQHKNDYFTIVNKVNHLYVGKKSFSSDPLKNIYIKRFEDYLIFFDGAIYSYDDGYKICEIYDYNILSSIIIEGYKKNKSVNTKQLNGEYSIGLYDENENRLMLMNDRWGFRELYYYSDENVFLFSSEAKAIIAFLDTRAEIDDHALIDYINFGYILGNRTLFKDIHLLPPASVIDINKNIYSIETMPFKFHPNLPEKSDISDYADHAYKLLDLAVTRRLRHRGKASSYLSGGLDSRIITGLLSKHINELHSFSISSDHKGKEYQIAKKVAKKLGNCNLELVKTSPEHMIKYLKWAVWTTDGMLSAGSVSPFLGSMINKLDSFNVLFGGFAGDLILGGSFIRAGCDEMERWDGKDLSLFMGLPEVKAFIPFLDNLFSKDFKEKIQYYRKESICKELEYIGKEIDLLSYDLDLFIILGRCRRCYNANRGLVGHVAIEEFYPFFDNDFFSFIYSLPLNIRKDHNLYAMIFKRYFYELGKVAWLKTGKSLYRGARLNNWQDKFLQDLSWKISQISQGKLNLQDKKAYAPYSLWYRSDPSFKKFIKEILLSDNAIGRNIFNNKGVEMILQMTSTGWDLFPLIDRMLIIELARRLFFDNDKPIISPAI